VEVVVHSDDPARFAPGSELLTADDLRPLIVRSLRRHRDRAVVAFKEVTDRTGAEALRGLDVVIPRERARTLEAGEFWDHDLIGSRVTVIGGEEVGVVTEVMHPPANDVLVVSGVSGEHLIPLVAAVVRSVDAAGRSIVIEPMPGLLDSD
jgi:16S rRNA processing protein RimM